MALYQPTNIFPSSFAGVGGGVIDVTDPLTVSWQVNGPSAMTAWRVQIFENTAASAQVYDSGQTALTAPFFGVTSKGEVNYFQTEIPASALTGLSNGFSSGYKMLITQWWDSGSVEQVSPSYFITRSTPSVSMSFDSFYASIYTKNITVKGFYIQEQGDTLDWFRWELGAQDDDGITVIEDSGYIYGSGDIRVSYDGLFPDIGYAIRLTVQTENGVQVTTGWKLLYVYYNISEMDGYVDACLSPTEGIVVQWPKVSYIEGVPVGNYAISGGDLTLHNGSKIIWSERNGSQMDFSAPWTLAWSGSVPGGGTEGVWEANNGALSFSVRPHEISLALNGTDLASIQASNVAPFSTIRMVLTPASLNVYYPVNSGGLYPSNTLYLSETVYPAAGGTQWELVSIPLTWTQPAITELVLNGEQICNYFMVMDGSAAGAILSDLLTDLDFEPAWTTDTLFLAGFSESGLNAGSIAPESESVTGIAVYRLKAGGKRMEFVANVPLGEAAIVDEGFRNQETYTYYVFAIGSDTYISSPLSSGQITPNFWNWTVLDCSQDESGVYHLEAAHLFRNNVSTDSISNNNSPSLLQNFTPYPLRQPSSYNFKSSTLTGYIGRVDMQENRYIDTVDMAKALYDLSVSTSPKFLRDRKGNLWRIQTSGAVSMQTSDTMAPQPYFGSLPWAEVGPADDVSIVCQPGDGAWEEVSGTGETERPTLIIVTAPPGTLITFKANHPNQYFHQEICEDVVTYEAPVGGLWLIKAELNGKYDSKIFHVSEHQTTYVEFNDIGIYAILTVTAPSGTSVTVTGRGYSETKVVP